MGLQPTTTKPVAAQGPYRAHQSAQHVHRKMKTTKPNCRSLATSCNFHVPYRGQYPGSPTRLHLRQRALLSIKLSPALGHVCLSLL